MELNNKKSNWRRIISISIGYLMIFAAIFVIPTILRNEYMKIYNEGVELLKVGKYENAVECFKNIPDYQNYKDISDLLEHEYRICSQCGSSLDIE